MTAKDPEYRTGKSTRFGAGRPRLWPEALVYNDEFR